MMTASRKHEAHFLSLVILENVNAVVDAMEDFAVSPCLVTLSLASMLQAPPPLARSGYLDLCCGVSQVCGANLVCVSCLCRCKKNYIYKMTTKTCEAQFNATTFTTTTNTATKNTSTGRKGLLPGQPCASASACVVGLVCQKSRCKCPDPCVYVAEQEACDCGPVEVSLVWPVIIGVSVGLVIIAFWLSCIAASINKHKDERNKVMQLQQHQQPVPRISTLGAAYGTAHLNVPPPPTPSATSPGPPLAPTPTHKALRISRQSVAPTMPTMPLQPVFRTGRPRILKGRPTPLIYGATPPVPPDFSELFLYVCLFIFFVLKI
ncbi:uncharacterized protein LOC123512877 isoform X2 [Portunus trituberculatus]|uniref:uncharacterized protein LOC123512877 isoform X2 n=1 Tax=Portunus trituberculatus TaxID=210409 RepID=UPI001E1D0749|nr:uncharacterized protein LOC123512877 isoform X2 [Portunus trituberculatus]